MGKWEIHIEATYTSENSSQTKVSTDIHTLFYILREQRVGSLKNHTEEIKMIKT